MSNRKTFINLGAWLVLFIALVLMAIPFAAALAAGLPQLPQLGDSIVKYQKGDVDCAVLLPQMLEQDKKAVLVGVWFKKAQVCEVYDISLLSSCKSHKGPKGCIKETDQIKTFKDAYLDGRGYRYTHTAGTAVFCILSMEGEES